MKNKGIKILCLLLMVTLVYSMPVFAQNTYTINGETERSSILLPSWETTSRNVKNNYMRGSVISTGILEIGNAGGGDIFISIQTLAHKECDEIQHKAYLERWDESTENWYTVDTYLFVEKKEDHPDEVFSSLWTTFTVLDQPTGYYYRVRGVHMATLNGRTQILSSKTDGLLITKN